MRRSPLSKKATMEGVVTFTLAVWNNDRFVALHYRNAGVGGSKVYAYDFSHDY